MSKPQAADLLGYSERQLRRWFQTYREEGLGGLCQVDSPGGLDERATPEAWEALTERMEAGEIPRLTDAQRFLEEEFGIGYESVSGISRLFDRRGGKLRGKTQDRAPTPQGR